MVLNFLVLLLQLIRPSGRGSVALWECSTKHECPVQHLDDGDFYILPKARGLPVFDSCNNNKSEIQANKEYHTTYLETRRHAIHRSLKSSLGTTALLVLGVCPGTVRASDSKYGVSDGLVSSFVFKKMLGTGSYKTVYMVSGTDPENNQRVLFALAVERLRSKRDAKDALRGISIARQLRDKMEGRPNDQALFENIVGWWVQDSSISEFSTEKAVFPDQEALKGRARKIPSQFLGSKWLVSVKSLYDMDLKTFAQRAPSLHPIGEHGPDSGIALNSVAGIPLTQQAAFKLAFELCHAGQIMHSEGLVHRDIKPKNIMLKNGHPVIIDFEFARFVNKKDRESGNRNNRLCITEPGLIKGDARYTLAEDIASYRGCQEGDCYAMGKTLYETIFGEAEGLESSGRQSITEAAAMHENERFRSKLAEGALKSRFHLTSEASNVLLSTIVGLCRQESPLTFADAKATLLVEMEKINPQEMGKVQRENESCLPWLPYLAYLF